MADEGSVEGRETCLKLLLFLQIHLVTLVVQKLHTSPLNHTKDYGKSLPGNTTGYCAVYCIPYTTVLKMYVNSMLYANYTVTLPEKIMINIFNFKMIK